MPVMASLRHKSTSIRDDGGAVTVLVALVLGSLVILLAGLVVNFGTWFEQKRHLQLQADAGALAGGLDFSQCNASASGGANSMENAARQYSGLPSTNGTPYNGQVGNPPSSTIAEVFNQATYPNGDPATPTDTTSYSGSGPCADSVLDVKMQQTGGFPWYVSAVGAPPIDAHARVSWSAIGSGFLPLAVDESSPLAVTAYFVDEATGNVIASTPLQNNGPVGSGAYASDDTWTNNAALPVTVNTSDIGVVLALSGSKTDTTCGKTHPLVHCFNQDVPGGTGNDLSHIQGYSTSLPGTATNPVIRSVTLPSSGSSCSSAVGIDSYFSNLTAGCNFLVRANIDFGSDPNPKGTSVAAQVAGNCTPLSYNSSGAYAGSWTGTAALPPQSGATNGVDILVGANNNCKKATTTFPNAQSAFAADSTDSGTIDGLTVSEQVSLGTAGCTQTTCLIPDANSFPMCPTCTHNLFVTADIGGSLKNIEGTTANPNPPLFALNFGPGTTTSQSGTIVCPPNNDSASQLQATLMSGCPGEYAINGTVHGGPDPSCTYSNPTAGQTPIPPADCVQTKNGLSVGPFDQGLACRFVGGSGCSASGGPSGGGGWYCKNNWSSYSPTAPFDGLPANDDRLITMFITPYNSFSTTGLATFPILDGAFFYVAGFEGDPCKSDPGPPTTSSRIWGYFIQYTSPGKGGDPTVLCKASALGACTTSLTQ